MTPPQSLRPPRRWALSCTPSPCLLGATHSSPPWGAVTKVRRGGPPAPAPGLQRQQPLREGALRRRRAWSTVHARGRGNDGESELTLRSFVFWWRCYYFSTARMLPHVLMHSSSCTPTLLLHIIYQSQHHHQHRKMKHYNMLQASGTSPLILSAN
jgi:hypothetical protein